MILNTKGGSDCDKGSIISVLIAFFIACICRVLFREVGIRLSTACSEQQRQINNSESNLVHIRGDEEQIRRTCP